uniref:Holocytochrome c-type synthase n=1 Tax=Globisporangium ultimum (strain ATCC 200006 / CBS 805.95 / DAOM BR144) TaxID=431595 RepID=K3WGY4_GLOUD
MGNQNSTPATSSSATGGCPVPHDQRAAAATPAVPAPDGCPVVHESAKQQTTEGGCPVKHDGAQKEIYNVYGQRIDPTNMMPYNPNQEPNDEQRYPLPQERVQSTIPKGGTEGTWLYPSEQMFYNALKRKGKGEDVHEADVPTIVSIHNNMNERAWAQVEHYEKVCHPESDPKLLKFCGRPDDLTPIAWVKNMLGFGKPFDRHDWTILRSDDTRVRYVIDYYFDDDKAAEDKVPELHSASSVKSISMYARPAVDSIGDLVDRVRFPLLGFVKGLQEPDIASRSALVEKAQQTETLEPLSVQEVEQTFAKIKDSCKNCFADVKTCQSEVDCSQAATALQLCMGQIICPTEATKLTQALKTGDESHIESAYETMSNSLEQFQERSANAMREQAAREAAREAAAAASK